MAFKTLPLIFVAFALLAVVAAQTPGNPSASFWWLLQFPVPLS